MALRQNEIHGLRFYTFDGDHASRPGKFTKAENNVNCRCVLKFEIDTSQD